MLIVYILNNKRQGLINCRGDTNLYKQTVPWAIIEPAYMPAYMLSSY